MKFSRFLWKLGNFVEPYGLLPKVYYRRQTAMSPLADAVRTGHYSLAEIERRYARYQAAEISIAISRHDDMYVRGIEGNLDHYLRSVKRRLTSSLPRWLRPDARDSKKSSICPVGPGASRGISRRCSRMRPST